MSRLPRLPRLSAAVFLSGSMSLSLFSLPAQFLYAQEAEKKEEMPAEDAGKAAAPDTAAPDAAAPEEKPAPAETPAAELTPAAEAKPAGEEKPAAAPTEPSAATPDAPAAEDVTPADAPLQDVAEAFLHYGTLARYDVAAIQGKKILDSGKKPEEILTAFEAVMARRNRDRRTGMSLENMLDTWSQIDQTKDVATKLRDVLSQARVLRMSDPKFIDQAIKDLIATERSYGRALALLKQSGELAVPQMVDYLRNPKAPEYHARIQRALVDMGRVTLNPLVASLEMKDADALVMVVGVLGDLGFDSTVPYLVDLRDRSDTAQSVHEAIDAALQNMGRSQESRKAGDLYYDLAEKFYYETTTILADKHYPNAFIWSMSSRGLVRKEVPHVIFNEVMAMRTSRRALELGSQYEAQALWLAADYKRESQLPQGAKDPTAPTDSAHFYGVDSGTQYLNSVLARAVRDHDSAVSLRAIKSLQEIVGRANLFAGDAGQPIIDGMRSTDRLVRFESAFTAAAALPEKDFPGQERVVPLLAEAVSQTGTPNVLVVAGTDESRTRVLSSLKGFGLAGATGGDAAIAEAASLPSVDVIVITKDVADDDVARVLELSGQSPRLDRALKVVVRQARGNPLERANLRRKDVVFTDNETGAGLTKQIDEGRNRSGGKPLEAAVATEYALRATRLLGQIAKAKGATVLDTSAAHQVLLNATADPRPEVAKEVAGVLAWIDTQQTQPALLTIAADDKTPADVRVALFKGLAGNAKNFGNQLDKGQFATVQNIVQKGDSPDLRNAAAEAAGALNLPGEQAKRLILGWKPEGAAQ